VRRNLYDGARQDGRPRGSNIIDAPFSASRITGAIQDAMAPSFKDQLKDLVNPFGDGHASERITEVLTNVELNQQLLVKRFCNYTVEPD
jgi:UDP-N-acetylglucosamine 2-epimerase